MNEKILEEFDDRLKEFVPTNTDQDIYLLAEDSKSFLSAKLDQARAEEREKAVEKAKDWFTVAPEYRTKEDLLSSLQDNPK